MIKSPSKHTSLRTLKKVRENNYLGDRGQEYCAEEVEAMIAEKEQKGAQEFVFASNLAMEKLARVKLINNRIEALQDISPIDEAIECLRKAGHKFVIRENVARKVKHNMPVGL